MISIGDKVKIAEDSLIVHNEVGVVVKVDFEICPYQIKVKFPKFGFTDFMDHKHFTKIK